MTIQEIKPLLIYGDIKMISQISGYSLSYVDKVINERDYRSDIAVKDIIKAATKLIKLRNNIKRSKRQVRRYNRKKKAS